MFCYLLVPDCDAITFHSRMVCRTNPKDRKPINSCHTDVTNQGNAHDTD